MFRIIIALCLSFFCLNCFSQVNFKKDYLRENPVDKNQMHDQDEKIDIHEAFLEKARAQKDTLRQLYGLFYLFGDYYRNNDYIELKKLLIEAENLIDSNSKPEWQGALRMRSAYLLEIIDKDLNGAVDLYKEAVEQCRKAQDTLCIAESLEQLSNLNKNLGNYDLAERYFKDAITLLKKHGTPESIALSYNNYSLLASAQEKFEAAENYIDSAIVIAEQNRDTFNHTMYISNKASIYLGKGAYNEAIKIYKELLPINIKNKWPDNLLFNYAGLVNSYEELRQYEYSNEYLQKYYELKDSLTGAEVQEKIIKLELKDQLNRNELVLTQKENQLQKAKILRDRLYWFIFLFVISTLFLFYFWTSSKRSAKKEKLNHLNYIKDLRNILQVKNSEIKSLTSNLDSVEVKTEEPIVEEKGQMTIEEVTITDLDFKVFDARIVNDEGVSAFKSYFDKIYPGLLIRIRKQWHSISDAEERLFMLIKLRIKSKEAADILGISQSSVKKSRNRLRKRLEIDPTIDLENFIDRIK